MGQGDPGGQYQVRLGASGRETAMLKIVAGGLDDPQVIRLLGIHLTNSRAQTAPGSAHALDLAGLKSPEICFWSAWDGDDLLAVAAMKRLSHNHGEVKSMHTAEAVAVEVLAQRYWNTSSTSRAIEGLRN